MKVDITLSEFKQKDLIPIKNILVFNEKKLKERLRNFYMFEKKLTNLSFDELKEWISLFKMNDETVIHIKIETDRIEVAKGKISNKNKLIITLYHILSILASRVQSDTSKIDRGRIVREIEDADEKIIERPVVEAKQSRKDMLTLRKV